MKYRIAVIAILVFTTTLPAMTKWPKDKCKSPIVPKEKTFLWNGKDFSGWTFFLNDKNTDPNKVWSIKDGVIRCEGRPKGYMRTENCYANYKIHLEWRWPEQPGNSGVLLHTNGPDKIWPFTIECQLRSGYAGDFWILGGGKVQIKQRAAGGSRVDGRNVKKLHESSEKPAGQWNEYDIICVDDWMVLLVNGVLQNVATKATLTSGAICLQSEGAPIEFRNIYIEPVE